MKRLLIGVVVLMSTQFCTSELNEIDGVVGDHIDSNAGDSGFTSIPSDAFLGQYFLSKTGDNPISSRIENRIRHDFKSPVRTDVDVNELSAKWTGKFYFESGTYKFSVNSDKGILVKIDNKVVVSDDENSEDNTYIFEEQLDGVHQIDVEYNFEGETTTNPVDNTTPTDPVDNTTITDPVDNTPTDPVDNTSPSSPIIDTSTSDPVVNNLTVNARGTDAAHFTVLVDGQEIGDAYTTLSYLPYMFTLPIDLNTINEIHIVHDNDAQNRNLDIESIEVDGKLIPATSENVTYLRTNGATPDYTGTMFWNGSLIFSMTEPSDITTPAIPVDNTTPADPVVEVDNGTPTVEVDWEPVDSNVLTFFEGFENGLNLNPPWHQTGLGLIETVTNPTIPGEFSVRMYLEAQKYASNIRAKSQIEYNPENSADVPRYAPWFSSHGIRFAMYVPSDYKKDPVSGLIWQLHNWSQCPVYGSISPNCAIYIANGKINFAIRYESSGSGKKEDVKYIPNRDTFTLVPGEWHYFVVDTHWDYRTNGNGFHRFYAKVGSAPTKNDLIVDYNGPTGFNATASHDYTGYPTIGVYKWGWTDQTRVDESVAAGVTHIEYFFDDFEIADSPYFSY